MRTMTRLGLSLAVGLLCTGRAAERCASLNGDPYSNILGTDVDGPVTPERVQPDSMSSDLRFILSEFEIPDRIQLRAVELGYKSLVLYAVLGDDRPAVHALIATDFFLKVC